MRALSMTFGSVFLLVSAVGCMHKGANNSAAKSVSAYEESDQDLTSDLSSRPLPVAENCEEIMKSMCTMEYNPQSCTYNGEKIEGGNPCGVKMKARYIACQKQLTFKEDDLKCELGNNLAKSEDCSERTVCTRELRPMVCKASVGDEEISERGNNKCEALNTLAQSFCSRKVAFDRSTATCEDAR